MEDELILSDKDRSKLDGIVNQMIENNEPDDNIQFVVNDFKGKYGVKKKESSEVSASQPSARPSASATSPRVPQPAQAREPIQPTFRTQAPDIFGAGRPVAQPKPAEQPKDQLSPAAKAQVQARVAKGEVAEAPAKKPEVKEAPAPESSSYLQAVEKDEFERANRVRSAVGDAESKLNEKNVDKTLSQSFDLGWGPNIAVKTEDSEDVQDARKKANTEIRDVFNVDFDVYVPNEQGVLVEDTEKIAVVKDYLQKSNQYEQYVKAQNTVDEAKRRLQEDPNAFPLTSQLLNTVPESIGLATALAFDAAGAGDTRAYSDEVRAKRTARRIALGLDENKGIVDNISEGNIGDAMKELMLAGADFVPQMAAFVINPAVGYAYNAASAGGSTYDQFRDRNDLSKGDKMALALTSAAADLVLNKLTMGAEKSIRASLGITAEELGTETAKKKALDYLNPLKNEVIGKGFFGEAAEEGGVNIINQIAASIIAGDEFDVNSLIDETLIGGVFGSTAVGLPKVLARGANGLANASMVSEFRKVTDQIKEINDALLNEELTPSQSELLTRQLEQLSLRQTEMSNASEQIYSAMTKEDQEALYEAHKQINEGLKTYNEAENKVVKNAAFSQVRQALLAKRDLENKYAGQVKTERDDSEEEVGVPSPVVEGEAVVETEPIEAAGQEAPEAGGVLQVPVEEGAEATKEELGPAVEDITFGTAFDLQDKTAERTVSDKNAWGGSGLIRERIENAGDILRELSSRGDRPDPGYIQEKIDKLRSWIPDNASVRSNAIPSDIKTIDDFNKTNLRFSNVTDGFEYLMKFNSDVVNKIRSEYEAIPTYTKEQKLAKDSVLALLNQDITGLEKNLDNLQDVVDTVKKEGKLEIVKSVDPESIKIIETSTSKVVKPTTEVVAPIEATVFAAPFYDTKVNNVGEARAIRQGEPYVRNIESIRLSAPLFNVEVDGVDESIGGFVNDAGDKIVEVSNIIRVKGTPEDVQNYAAFLATSSPETQEATIAASYVEQNDENHNVNELTYAVSDIDGAIDALKENDIYDFTINDSNNTITFLDFSKGTDNDFKIKIGTFVESLEQKNINYEERNIRAVNSKYIGPEERSRILGSLQQTILQQGQTGTELYRQVEQAIAKNEEFLRKTQASETEAEVAPEAQATEQDAASLEGVTIRAIKPEQGKTLKDIRKSYEESIKPSITPKTVLENVKEQLIDRQSKIKRAVLDIGLRNAYDRIVNKAGTSARANDKYLRAEKKIYKGLSEDEIKLLDDIIFARRVIQIDKNFDARKQKRPKHPLGYTSENAVFELDSFKEKFGEQKYNDLIRRSDLYFDEFRSILKDLYGSGLITKETYENLRTNNYQPRKFIEHVYDFKNSKFLLKDNGLTDKQIRAIEEGSEKDLIMNSRFLLASYLLSSSNRILSNRTNQALSKAIGKKEGTSEWIRPLKDGDDADKGFSKVSYLEKGELKRFQLRSDLKEELDNVSTSIGDNGRFLSIALGVPLIKLMATGANPIFAVKNVFRDFGHVLFFTNIYDKHNIYYATYLLFKDYRKGLKSAMQDDQDFKDYMDLGGGMSFLASAGRDGKLSNKTFKDKVLNFLGKPGELSEISMRIAVYKRFKEEGINAFEKKNNTKPTGEDLLEIKESSVAKAREIIDFQQGGNLVKSMDKFVPYLNAAFQGFRVGSTYIANNPIAFGRKFVEAQIGLLALSFLNSLASDDEDMQNIPEHTRLMNFIIFIPFTNRKDEDGVERKAFIKIPKTQQAAPFFALMDVANRKIINDVFGKEYDVSEDEYNFIMSGLKKSLPIGLSSALGITDVAVRKAVGGAKDEKIENEAFRDLMQTVPLLNAVGTYMSNYDAFRDRMITMEKEEVLPSFEGVSDPSVEKFYKVIGETTGMSPIRTKAATEKLITSPQSSLVIGMAYGLLDAMAEKYDLDKGDYNIETLKSDDKNALKNIGLNVKKAFINETDPKWKLYSQKETLDNIDKEAGTERARLRTKAKELAMGTNKQEQLDKSIAEAQKLALEIAKKNPIDAKFFIESFKSNIGESPALPQSIEIQYSASDKARAEKIKFLFNPQTKEDFSMIMRDVYQQTGYKISPKTIYEYQQAYGELK